MICQTILLHLSELEAYRVNKGDAGKVYVVL